MQHSHSPALLVGGARCCIGLGETDDADRGQFIQLLLREVAGKAGGAWDAAFVHHVGYWTHFGGGSAWPLPPVSECDELAGHAQRLGILDTTPRYGDLFLLWSRGLRRFVRTGIVIAASKRTSLGGRVYYLCETIEGNTNMQGEIGRSTLQMTREITPDAGDRFVHWADVGCGAPVATQAVMKEAA